MALVLTLVFVAAGVSSGHGAAAPPDPDPDVLSRLRAIETSGGKALLVGVPVQVGMENPERVFLPVLVFDLDEDRAVTVVAVTVAGPDGKVRATARPSKRLGPVSDVAKTKAEVLSHIADRDQERAVASCGAA